MIGAENPASVREGGPGAVRAVRHRTAFQVYRVLDAAWLEQALLARYGSHYSTVARLNAAGLMDAGTEVFVAQEGDALRSVLLFRRQEDYLQVLNEVATISEAEIAEFAEHAFTRWPTLQVIVFKAIHTDLARLSRPFQRFNYLEDFVITLPGDVETYHARLGPSLRKTLRGYGNKLRRSYPEFSQRVVEGPQIEEEHVRAILAFSRERIVAQGKRWGIDDAECDRIVSLARECGLATMIVIDGAVCAGAVSYRAGDSLFMRVCAHDMRFDALRLGTIVRACAIEDAIRRGVRECHLLWGRQPYKAHFLAEPVGLDKVTIYRSRVQMLRHTPRVLSNWREATVRQMRLAAGGVRAWRQHHGG